MTAEWDHRFLALAQHIAAWSKDPSTQIGAVIVDDDRRIISAGYNGAPRRVQEPVDRNDKLFRTIHAEANALHFAGDVRGCTIYVTAPPCAHCAGHIIQRGIKRIVCSKGTEQYQERWKQSIETAMLMLHEAGVLLQTI